MSLYGTLASQTFKNNAGSSVARPHFMATGNWGSYTHTFQSNVSNTSYTNQSGMQAYPAFNNVDGLNTTGFTTSSTPGSSYYDIPLDGVYAFNFCVLLDTSISNHIDATFQITDTASNTYRGTLPWDGQYIGQSATTYAPTGWMRLQESDGIVISVAATAMAKFYQGQRIRPMIGINTNISVSIYQGGGHNYWHGAYIGA